MAVDALLSAIRAALDETERIAREAAAVARGDSWRPDELGCCAVTDEEGVFLSAEMGHFDPGPVIAHVARHDPAAVLRRVKYDREIVDWCAEVIGTTDLSLYGRFGSLRQNAEPLAVTLAVETLRALARGLGIDTEEDTDRG